MPLKPKPKKVPPGPDRDAVVARYADAGWTATALAKEIGVSRQYAGQLIRAHKRRAVESLAAEPEETKPEAKEEVSAVEAKPETETSGPAGIPPLPPAPGEAAAGAGASNPLDDALRGIPADGAPGADAGPFQPEVIGAAPSALDQKRIAAGKKLAALVNRGMGKALARRVFHASPDDPRMKELDRPNEILELALEESDKQMHFLGGLVRGVVGLGLGFFVEVFRVQEIFGAPPENQPAARQRREAPAPAAQEVGEKEEDIEEPQEGGTPVDFTKRDNIPGL